MELPWMDFCLMPWNEFEYLQIGYARRIERGFDYTRHMIAGMFNSSGWSKKSVSAKDVIRLPHLDKVANTFRRIPKEKVKRMLAILDHGNN